MIGAGIFVLTGIAAGVAGPGLILAFALNGIVTLFAAAAYAELGSAFHDAGGGYLWVKTGLKDPNGFMSGWMSWFAHAVACSLYALGFGAYFNMVLKIFHIQPYAPLMSLDKWLAVLVVGLFAFINYRGASEAGKAGTIITIGKISHPRRLHRLRRLDHASPARLAGSLRGLPAQWHGRRLHGDGSDFHRLRRLRDHRPVQRGGARTQKERPPRRLSIPDHRHPHLPPGCFRRARRGGYHHGELEVPGAQEGAGTRRGRQPLLQAAAASSSCWAACCPP